MKFVPPRKVVLRSRKATKAPVISPDPRAHAPLVSEETALFFKSRMTKFFLKPDKNITRAQLLVVNPRPHVVGYRSTVVRQLRTPPHPPSPHGIRKILIARGLRRIPWGRRGVSDTYLKAGNFFVGFQKKFRHSKGEKLRLPSLFMLRKDTRLNRRILALKGGV